MNKMSHRLFALGISAAFAFFLNLQVIALPLILVISYFIGSLPDIDIRIGIKHRGFTHTIFFFFIMTFVSALGMFYLYWGLQFIIGVDIFDVEMVFYNGVPTPAFFTKIFAGDVMLVFQDVLFKYFVFFFAAYMTHFTLDIITPAGLTVGSFEMSGSIKSSNKAFNMFFTGLGLMITLLSITFIVLRDFTTIDIGWSSWFFISVGVIILIVIIVSIAFNRHNGDDNLRCFKLDNNIEICLPEGRCFQVGVDKDDRICNINDVDL